MNDFEKRLLSHGTFNRTDGEIQTKMALETEALRQAGKPQRLVESSEDYHRRLASFGLSIIVVKSPSLGKTRMEL